MSPSSLPAESHVESRNQATSEEFTRTSFSAPWRSTDRSLLFHLLPHDWEGVWMCYFLQIFLLQFSFKRTGPGLPPSVNQIAPGFGGRPGQQRCSADCWASCWLCVLCGLHMGASVLPIHCWKSFKAGRKKKLSFLKHLCKWLNMCPESIFSYVNFIEERINCWIPLKFFFNSFFFFLIVRSPYLSWLQVFSLIRGRDWTGGVLRSCSCLTYSNFLCPLPTCCI